MVGLLMIRNPIGPGKKKQDKSTQANPDAD